MSKFWSKVENTFNKIGGKIKSIIFGHEKVNRIITLMRMQLKNKKRLIKEKSIKDKIILTGAKLILFVGMFFLFYYGIYLFMFYTKLQYIRNAVRLPGSYTTFILAIYLVVSIISTSVAFINDIYRAKDNALLLSYPVSTADIFTSKLLVKLINEIKKSLMIILPFLVGVYLNKKLQYSLTTSYIGWTIFLTFAIPLIIVSVSGVLSILFTYLDVLFKKINLVKVIFFSAIAGAGFAVLIYLVNKIPLHLEIFDLWFTIVNNISAFINSLTKYEPLSSAIVSLLLKSNMVSFAIIMSLIVVSVLANILVCYRFFFALVYKPIKDKPIALSRRTSNKQHKSIFFIFLRKELKTYSRSEDGLITSLIYVLVLPILLYCLNRVFASFNISHIGTAMIMTVDILVSIVLITASNISVANSISREGSEFYLLKVSPIETKQIAVAKILVNLLLTIIAAIGVYFSLTLIIDLTGANFVSKEEALTIAVVVGLVSLAHVFWSIELDIKNPKIKQVMAGQTDNSNVTASLFIGLGLAVVVGLLNYFFKRLNVYGYNPNPLNSIVVVAAFIFVSRLVLFIGNLNAYFDEITM